MVNENIASRENGNNSTNRSILKRVLFSIIIMTLGLLFTDSLFFFAGNRTINQFYVDRARLRKFDDVYGSSLRPNVDIDQCRINGQGYREDHEIALARSENEQIRILVLGDSIMFGAKVSDELAFCCQLEDLIDREIPDTNHSEVINTAVMWWGPTQYLLRYQREGRNFKPDIVLIGGCPNDVTDVIAMKKFSESKTKKEHRYYQTNVSGEDLRGDTKLERTIYTILDTIMEYSYFANFVYDQIIKKEIEKMESQRIDEINSMNNEELLAPYLMKMRELMLAIKEPKVFLLFPSINYATGKHDEKYFPYEPEYHLKTQSLLEQMNVPCIKVLDVYKTNLGNQQDREMEDYFTDLHHPSALGHKVTAESVLEYLRSNNLIQLQR